ncbi:MAG: EamA family transporter, partial [Candidatus Bipolaricaulota bacterium]
VEVRFGVWCFPLRAASCLTANPHWEPTVHENLRIEYCVPGMATRRAATLLGLVSIVLWATTVPVARSLTTRIGLLPAGALSFTASGFLLALVTTWRTHSVRWPRRLSAGHLVACGPPFVGYLVLLYAALALATSDRDAIVAGLANYIWPSMILVFSVFVLGSRPRRVVLGAGIVLALVGIALAGSSQVGGTMSLVAALRSSPWAIGLGLIAGALWGLYSTLARRHTHSG